MSSVVLLWLTGAAQAAETNFRPYETGFLDRGISFVGIFVMVLLAWLISESRWKVRWRTVAWGIALQVTLGVVVLNPYISQLFYGVVDGGVRQLLAFSDKGTEFVIKPFVPHVVLMQKDHKAYVVDGTDCDDADVGRNPTAIEVCDGVDNDCDGKLDDLDDSVVDRPTWYRDADGDGFGGEARVACFPPEKTGWVEQGGDCDDSAKNVHPGAAETDCASTRDMNCDGSVGSDDRDGDGVAACKDCDDVDPGVRPDASEVCNRRDDDCDGLVDDDDPDVVGRRTWYLDADGDGRGGLRSGREACFNPFTGAPPPEEVSASATPPPPVVPSAAEPESGSESVPDAPGKGSASIDSSGEPSVAAPGEPTSAEPAGAPPTTPGEQVASWAEDYVPVPVTGLFPTLLNMGFGVLPTIIFFSALMSVLYHIGLMQWVVKGLAWVMIRTLGTSGAETLSAAGNIFVGQTEAPLLVRPYVNDMTRSELSAVMTGGFATVAGGVLGMYVSYLQAIPNIAGHLVMASIISAPAALAISKVIIPELGTPQTAGKLAVNFEKTAGNFLEAAANGATEGMKLVLNVAAMLIAIVALVAMVDYAISWVPLVQCVDGWTGGYTCPAEVAGGLPVPGTPLGMSTILGWMFAPIAFFMGVPWSETTTVGGLLGEKIVLTELIAYAHLGEVINAPDPVLSQRSAIIASYALCGFANFASIGIQIGGIGGLAPKRLGELAQIGFKAMIGGAIAACMTGCVAGLFM